MEKKVEGGGRIEKRTFIRLNIRHHGFLDIVTMAKEAFFAQKKKKAEKVFLQKIGEIFTMHSHMAIILYGSSTTSLPLSLLYPSLFPCSQRGGSTYLEHTHGHCYVQYRTHEREGKTLLVQRTATGRYDTCAVYIREVLRRRRRHSQREVSERGRRRRRKCN